jgi:hypothetical protein
VADINVDAIAGVVADLYPVIRIVVDAPLSFAFDTTAPVVGGFSPAVGTAVSQTQGITFTITDAAGFGRIVVLAQFPNIKVYEVVHDGDAFSQRYPASVGNVKTAIANGFSFTVLRQEGWPASPKLVPMGVDTSGNLNPISSVNYAWTLV